MPRRAYTGGASNSSKRTSITSKHEIYIFFFSVGLFAFLDPDPDSQSGSGSKGPMNLDSKPWIYICTGISQTYRHYF
jgi:hypothetical protein